MKARKNEKSVMDSDNKKIKRFTGVHFLLFIVGFFAIVIIVNGIMAYIAIDTFSGLENEDAYRRGRDYNKLLEAARVQSTLGWQEEVSFVRTGSGEKTSDRVILILHGAEKESALSAEIAMKHPATTSLDKKIVLVQTGPARFEGVIEGLAQGRWRWSLVVQRHETIVFRKNSEIIMDAK